MGERADTTESAPPSRGTRCAHMVRIGSAVGGQRCVKHKRTVHAHIRAARPWRDGYACVDARAHTLVRRGEGQRSTQPCTHPLRLTHRQQAKHTCGVTHVHSHAYHVVVPSERSWSGTTTPRRWRRGRSLLVYVVRAPSTALSILASLPTSERHCNFSFDISSCLS